MQDVIKLLNSQIDAYLLSNPRKDNEQGYYKRVADIFDSHPEKIRGRLRKLKAQSSSGGEKATNYLHVKPVATTSSTITWSGDVGTYRFEGSEEPIESLNDLVRVCNIDTDNYDITGHEIKSYNAWIKNKDGEIEQKKLFSVKATLKLKKNGNPAIDKNIILEEIKKASLSYQGQSPVIDASPIITLNVPERQLKNHALEINIPDLHIGKLAWAKETGEDYDISIAIERYTKAVRELVSRVNPHILEKIILPVGNDLINVDNAGNMTTAGTHVSCDSRFGKMFQAAKKLLVETIDFLSHIAPVHVEIVPGNHDTIATFTLGETLDAWYHNNERVVVSNTHTPRKYLQYGQNLIMYTHGHREKLNDLGIICATEQPQLWAATKYRRVHVGHFHHSKQVKFTDVQEYPGFTVKILNSLSANDAWHAEKGYMSLKGAEAFLYNKEKGLVANYYYLHN